MSNTMFLILFFLSALAIAFFRSPVARSLTRAHVADLKRRRVADAQIAAMEEKLIKSLKNICLVGGIFFSVVSALLLAAELGGFFIEQSVPISTVAIGSILRKLWDFAGWVLLIVIILYVFEWYGLFTWPWRDSAKK